LLELFEEARKDFSKLTQKDVKVVHFWGQSYSGTFGIEFTPPNEVPKTYRSIKKTELSR
jgi:hypothetical protein